MYIIPTDKEAELLPYFRRYFPEFATLSDTKYGDFLTQAVLYIPGRLNKSQNQTACGWAVKKELLNLWVAHMIMLFGIMEQEDPANPQPIDLVRLATSLSEGGLSASYGEITPRNGRPETVYEYLSKTSYGERAKVLLEQCLSGACGAFTV